MAIPTTAPVNADAAALQPENKPLETKNKAPECTEKTMNVFLRVIEGVVLIFANIVTFGFINFIPAIHDEYRKVFGGKKVEVLEDDNQPMATVATDDDVSGDNTAPATVAAPVRRVSAPADQPAPAPVPHVPPADDEEPQMYGAGDFIAHHWSKRGEYANQAKSAVSQAYGACNKENAAWAGGKIKEGCQSAYSTATSPENIRKTAAAAGAVGVAAISTLFYTMMGGEGGDAILETAVNGTLA